MNSPDPYDIIIAGAGASGLGLIWQILQRPELRSRRILLVDQNLKPVRDKTWCFWDDRHLPFHDMVYHSWDMLQVRAKGHLFADRLTRYQYHCVKSDVFAGKIFEFLGDFKNVVQLEADIAGFSHNAGEGVVATSEGTFRAPYVFQSIMRPPDLEKHAVDISLIQHFKGWHIRTRHPVFDPKKATLMDFDVPQKGGVTFVYVLPFNENEALVEYTLFSKQLLKDEEYETGLSDFLADRYDLGQDDYELQYTEAGKIPMTDQRFPVTYCENVWNIGSVSGQIKPSTGYAFTRILQQGSEIASRLARSGTLSSEYESSYRFRVYDIMMLYQLFQHPDVSITLFHELFRRNRFDRILQFLEERTRVDQELRIFYSLPWYPFFESIYRMKHRIFTGA